jgi:ketosteroid isomerase-like protein
MSEKNRETVRKVNEAFLNNYFEGFLDYCANDVQWTIVGEKTVRGKEAIRQWFKEMAATNSEPPKFTVADPIIAEGDFVVARGDMKMKDKDGLPGQYSYCDFYRFRNGEIVELNSFVVKTTPKTQASGKA